MRSSPLLGSFGGALDLAFGGDGHAAGTEVVAIGADQIVHSPAAFTAVVSSGVRRHLDRIDLPGLHAVATVPANPGA